MPRILSFVVLMLFVTALPAIAQEQRRMRGEGMRMEMPAPSKEEFLRQMDETLDKLGKAREKVNKGEAAPDVRMMQLLRRMAWACDRMLSGQPAMPGAPGAPATPAPPAEKK